jgi:SAM-dependent methyltransferase
MTDPRPPGPSTTGFDFDRVSVEDYERYRPDYAPEAVDWLLDEARLAAGARVVDLAAGTGKLTRLLVGAGCDVTAVEPSTAMRSKLAATVPSARALDGRAESIPLPDASIECVTVAQAFHHFQAGAAIPEIHRVLRPRGTLALFWNVYEKNRANSTRSSTDSSIRPARCMLPSGRGPGPSRRLGTSSPRASGASRPSTGCRRNTWPR